MFAEKHHDLSNLEQEFRRLLKHYRSLLRWGVDKVFNDARTLTDGLFIELRQYIDSKNTSQAKVALDELLNRLHDMEQNFTTAKEELVVSARKSINFLESIFSGNASVVNNNELQAGLERARIKLEQNEWQQANLICQQLFLQYKQAHRQALLNDKFSLLSDEEYEEVKQKLVAAFDSELACKLISLDDLDKMYQLAQTTNTATLRIGFFASVENITKLFAGLSQKHIAFEGERAGQSCALLRLPVKRGMTIYLVGVPSDQLQNSNQLYRLASEYSMVFFDGGELERIAINVEEILKSCTKHLLMESVAISKPVVSNGDFIRNGVVSELCIDSLDKPNVVKKVYDSIDSAYIYR